MLYLFEISGLSEGGRVKFGGRCPAQTPLRREHRGQYTTFQVELEVPVRPALPPAPLHQQIAAQIHLKPGHPSTSGEVKGRNQLVYLFYSAQSMFKKWSQHLKIWVSGSCLIRGCE